MNNKCYAIYIKESEENEHKFPELIYNRTIMVRIYILQERDSQDLSES